jgi:hypothetical protein
MTLLQSLTEPLYRIVWEDKSDGLVGPNEPETRDVVSRHSQQHGGRATAVRVDTFVVQLR